MWYHGKHYQTDNERKECIEWHTRWEVIYDDDELYARAIRRRDGVDIFDELPDGWHIGINFHDGRSGLRNRRENMRTKYLWCETDVPMYKDRWPGDIARNAEYRQALVLNPNWRAA